MSARTSPPARWLHGPVPDLLLGCGLAWMGAAALHATLGGQLERWIPGILVVLVLSFPHYWATLLRVYATREERRRYAFFAVYLSAALFAAFVLSLHSLLLGSILVTLYMTWSPWHYTGQNYGIALMLMGRRGVTVSPVAKRLLYVSFFASFVLTFLALHGGDPDARYAPATGEGGVYRVLPLGIPAAVVGPAVLAVGAVYGAALLAAVVSLGRGGRLRDLAPAVVLVATQGLWFAVPVLARHFGLLSGASLAGIYSRYGFLWIAGAHAAQYLWVTSYYARAQAGGSSGHLRYLGRAALAGFAIWTLPTLIFAPKLVSGVSYDAGLALLVAAVVNVHHFVLDGAIWKLRDGRIARLLVRGQADATPASAVAAAGFGRRWAGRAVFAVGVACVAVSLAGAAEREWGFDRALAQGDVARARRALDRLAWVGRDSAALRLHLGRELARRQRERWALEQFQRSVAIRPTPEAWEAMATLRTRRREWDAAAAAWDRAAALQPDNAGFLYRSGLAWVEAGNHEEGERRLARAAELAPDEELIAVSLGRVRRGSASGAAGPYETGSEAAPDAPRR